MIIPLRYVRKRQMKDNFLMDTSEETPMSRLNRNKQSTCSEKPLLLSATSEISNMDELGSPKTTNGYLTPIDPKFAMYVEQVDDIELDDVFKEDQNVWI